MERLTREELANCARDYWQKHGEVVWEWNIVLGPRRFARDYLWTSLLAREFVRLRSVGGDPDAWIVNFESRDQWRLYIREGENYSETGEQYFVPPVRIGIKSSTEYLAIQVPPRQHWWQAPFVCPFCKVLCVEATACGHCLVMAGSVRDEFRESRFHSLYRKMWNQQFNCNLSNALIRGLKIKLSKRFLNGDWFRFAYWYVTDLEVLGEVEAVLLGSLADCR